MKIIKDEEYYTNINLINKQNDFNWKNRKQRKDLENIYRKNLDNDDIEYN